MNDFTKLLQDEVTAEIEREVENQLETLTYVPTVVLEHAKRGKPITTRVLAKLGMAIGATDQASSVAKAKKISASVKEVIMNDKDEVTVTMSDDEWADFISAPAADIGILILEMIQSMDLKHKAKFMNALRLAELNVGSGEAAKFSVDDLIDAEGVLWKNKVRGNKIICTNKLPSDLRKEIARSPNAQENAIAKFYKGDVQDFEVYRDRDLNKLNAGMAWHEDKDQVPYVVTLATATEGGETSVDLTIASGTDIKAGDIFSFGSQYYIAQNDSDDGSDVELDKKVPENEVNAIGTVVVAGTDEELAYAYGDETFSLFVASPKAPSEIKANQAVVTSGQTRLSYVIEYGADRDTETNWIRLALINDFQKNGKHARLNTGAVEA